MRILFLGYERRYEVLIDSLKSKHDIYTLGYNDIENVNEGSLSNINFYDLIVLPFRGINNLNLDSHIFENYKGKIYTGLKEGIKGNVESFLDDDEIVKENTKICVDGIMNKIADLKKNVICILGYGNIGSMLYKKLKDDSLVFIGIKDSKYLYLDNSFLTKEKNSLEFVFKISDLVINTVPNHIVDDSILKNYKGKFLDIASYPYAIDLKKVDNYPFYYEQYLSIPSKYAPDRAGKILLKKF